MNRITIFLMGMVVGALGLYLSENFYLIRSQESFHLIPKIAAKIEFPYYDIRSYTTEDWNKHPSLAIAILRTDKPELMAESGLSNMEKQLQGLVRSISGS